MAEVFLVRTPVPLAIAPMVLLPEVPPRVRPQLAAVRLAMERFAVVGLKFVALLAVTAPNPSVYPLPPVTVRM